MKAKNETEMPRVDCISIVDWEASDDWVGHVIVSSFWVVASRLTALLG